ncbi:hypothetical protein [Embleya sp. NPDC059237]|uniref:hypothetical protein n=1 Tax=Embleya sp. NPDC059237 TaxID=3346784 RepID=UPI003693EA36
MHPTLDIHTTIDTDRTIVAVAGELGLNLLLKLRERAGTEGETLELHGVSERVQFVLDLTGTRNLFALRPNTRAA